MNTRKITYILILALLWMVNACIKPYDPQIDEDTTIKYVVAGRITDTEGWHEVSVSLSSPLEHPDYLPVSGCLVNIQDDRGNSFELHEFEPGSYRVWIEKTFLNPGTSYKVSVLTPDGTQLESSFDKMTECPPLDSVYYILEDLPTKDPSVFHRVMQIYVDLQGEGYPGRYYKWEIIETWEYHSANALEYYYDGSFHKVDPVDSSNYYCWITGLKPEVYTISTTSLGTNTYLQYPLNWIDGESSRLGVLYSMFLRQMALSEEAYNYWEQLRINSTQEGGLYEKQPLAIKGNVQNLTDPERVVLGFFYAAAESTRRYFYKDIGGIELTFSNYCQEDNLGRFGWREFRPSDYPVYYYFNEQGALRILNDECVECKLRGGTTEKPEFWP